MTSTRNYDSKDLNTLNLELVSVQGLIFESFGSSDDVYAIQAHILYNSHSFHSEMIPVYDTKRPIVIQYTVAIPGLSIGEILSNHSNEEVKGHSDVFLILITCKLQKDIQHEGNLISDERQQIIIAQAVIDLNTALLYAGDYVMVELMPCLVDYIYSAGEAPGSMYLRITIPSCNIDMTTRSLLEESIRANQATLTRVGRETLLHLKTWWSSLRRDYPHLNDRHLKFVTEDECGRHRFVGNFVDRIMPSRDLNGPRFAARFVSLIPFKREVSLSGGRVNRWHSPFATLSRLSGDVEDHSVLLCSLLLGWGLNAFVAMGSLQTATDQSIQLHTWVITFCETGKVTYWESLTGEVIEVGPSLKESHYRDIWAIFRQNEYLANIQYDCKCISTSYHIRNPQSWRSFALPRETSQLLGHSGCLKALESISSKNSIQTLEIDIETSLKTWIIEQRYAKDLQSSFDEQLSVLLQSSLASYEFDRITGISYGNTDFQSSIRSYVHHGECFKAYPTCFNHCNIEIMRRILSKTSIFVDILHTKSNPIKGGHRLPYPARFGLRVKVFPYPRDLYAVWVIFAVCYQDEKEPRIQTT